MTEGRKDGRSSGKEEERRWKGSCGGGGEWKEAGGSRGSVSAEWVSGLGQPQSRAEEPKLDGQSEATPPPRPIAGM